MFSDRINWIDLIFFHGFHPPGIRLRRSRWRTGMKPRKHNSASAEKRAEEPITGAFPLALLFCWYNDWTPSLEKGWCFLPFFRKGKNIFFILWSCLNFNALISNGLNWNIGMKLPVAPLCGISDPLRPRLAGFPFHSNKLQGIQAKANNGVLE